MADYTPKQELTREAVLRLIRECLAPDGGEDTVIARMFGNDYALNVNGREEEIRDLLYQLPDEFVEDTGAGHSLLGAIFRSDGVRWAENYVEAQHLLALGVAARIVEELFPIWMRQHLPEGAPYYIVKTRY